MVNNFTHLHLHTEYSLLDSIIQIPELVKYCQEVGMTSCAISDHGVLGGVITFYESFKKAGMHPLVGCESYLTNNPDGLFNEDKIRDNYHALLIAKDSIGYERLLKLSSNAALNNFYYKPRIYREYLRELGGHVVMGSGCLGGVLAAKLEWELDQYGRAIVCIDKDGMIAKEVEYYLNIFGDDFYLELMVYDSDDNYQKVYNQWLLNLGRDRKIPFIITADCHYLRKEDAMLHEILMAMQLKQTLQEYRDNNNMKYGPYFYVASPEEMLERAKSLNCEEAYYNTIEVANKCNVEIQLGKYQEPIFKIEDEEDYKEFLNWKEENGHVANS